MDGQPVTYPTTSSTPSWNTSNTSTASPDKTPDSILCNPSVQAALMNLKNSNNHDDKQLYRSLAKLTPVDIGLELEKHGKKDAAITVYRCIVDHYPQDHSLNINLTNPVKEPIIACHRLGYLLMPAKKSNHIEDYKEAISYFRLTVPLQKDTEYGTSTILLSTNSDEVNSLIGDASYRIGQITLRFDCPKLKSAFDCEFYSLRINNSYLLHAINLGLKKASYEIGAAMFCRGDFPAEKIVTILEEFIAAFPNTTDEEILKNKVQAHHYLGEFYSHAPSTEKFSGYYSRPPLNRKKANEHYRWTLYHEPAVQDALTYIKNSGIDGYHDLYKSLANLPPIEMAHQLAEHEEIGHAISIYQAIVNHSKYGRYIKINPINPIADPIVASLRLGYLHLPKVDSKDVKDYQEAIDYFRGVTFIEINVAQTDSTEVNLLIGEAKYMFGKLYMNLKGSKSTLTISPDDIEEVMVQARELGCLRANYSLGIIRIDPSLKGKNRNDAAFNFEQFIHHFSTATNIEIRKELARAHYHLGEIHSHASSTKKLNFSPPLPKDLNKALRHYQKALEIETALANPKLARSDFVQLNETYEMELCEDALGNCQKKINDAANSSNTNCIGAENDCVIV